MDDRFNLTIPFENPVLIFALVMLIILLAPLVFKKLKIPGIVGLILSGTVVGPGLLGLLERDFTIELLGTVGLLYLMFMAGLSIDLNRFEKMKEKSGGFGVISFLLPQLGAVWIGTQFLDYSMATSLLLGSIVGSHTLLAYPIAERLGITKNPAVTMSMGGTLVTDTLSLGVLAIVAGTAGSDTGPGYWAGFATSVAVFVAAALLILPRLGRWFFRNVQYQNNTDYVFMVAVLFTTAFFAELAGLAPIIGAFMAGLLLNRLVPGSSTLMSRVQFVGNALFIPFFLISVGMLVDVKVLGSLDVWVKAFIFTGLVLVGKGMASAAVRYLFRYSNEEGLVVFGLTTPQSAATLAVTLVGYDLGFFDQTAVNAVVIMILFTCLIGPWLVEKYGRIVARQEDEKPFDISEAPQRILVPLANPETSDTLMDIAFMVRDIKSEQPVFPLTVARDGANVESNVARGEKMLSHAVIHAAAADVPVNPVTRVDLNVSKGIARAVEEKLITNVIIGWNGEVSAKRKIFGSILDQLLEEVDEMVMVCKLGRPVNTFERIYIAVPPFASLETGFAESIRSIKLMGDQLGVELVMITTSERREYLKKASESIKPDLDIDYQVIGTWADLPDWIESNKRENDLFVLLSAREGSISWRPALDRLPRVISQKYPALNFIAIYPSEVRRQTDDFGFRAAETGILREDRIKLNLQGNDLESILSEIITGDPELSHIDPSRIVKRLASNSADYTPEVMPGVVLYESHTSKVHSQKLFIGIKPDGVKVEKTSKPVSVFMVFLTPKDLPAQQHLDLMNSILNKLKPGTDMKNISEAKTPGEVMGILAMN
jgi:Kef-type K+ transport system membrane component KefB/mannitol/fructose-specific phosphotransferase system IIA component (Ntr-type)